MKKILLLAACSIAAVSQVRADTIADWTFESTLPATAGPFSPEAGAGSATGSHAGAAVYSTPAGNGSSHSFSANTWAVNDYYQVQVSTLGYQSIQLSFDQASSGTGPGKFLLEYGTDGNSFTALGGDYTILVNGAPNVAWNATTYNPAFTFTADFSAITGLNNASSVYFRFVDDSTASANGGTVATAGTDRMDNIVVSGTVIVPEPSSIALMGMGLAATGLSVIRRKK